MAIETANPASAAARTGSEECSLPGGVHNPIVTQKSPRVQAAIAGLTREFVAECLRIAAIKATHGADNLEIGDDHNAERDIRIAVQNIREAGRAFRELQHLLKEEAAR